MDIDPQDIDPDTGRPYRGYSSPALDTSFHDGEAAGEDDDEDDDGDRICDYCGGSFLPEDMDGDHCADCAAELFGDDGEE